jgi:hypothetical protein
MKTLKEFTTWLEEQAKTKSRFDFEQFSKFTDRTKALRYLVTSDIKQLGSGTFRAAFHRHTQHIDEDQRYWVFHR